MEMIQFGAASVFRTSDADGELSSIDIDALLLDAEKRTKEVMDKLEAVGGKGEEVRLATTRMADPDAGLRRVGLLGVLGFVRVRKLSVQSQ